MSLKNSNKRKGYKDRLKDAHGPQRIVFNGGTPERALTAVIRPSKQRAPLIPPSGRTDLPENIIVTSIDVEQDYWGAKSRSNKANSSTARTGYLDPKPYYANEDPTANEDVTLDYGTEVTQHRDVDWSRAEAEWETSSEVDLGALKVGNIVGWHVRVA